MKICFMGPPVGECGGIQRVMVSVANEMAQHHEVTILSIGNAKENSYYPLDPSVTLLNQNQQYGGKGKLLRRIGKKAAKILNLVLPAKAAAWIYYPKDMVEDLTAVIKRERFDCVVASAVPCTLLLGQAASGLQGVRLIGWHHNSFSIYFTTPGRGFYQQQQLAKKMLKKLDVLVSLTKKDAAEYWNQMQIPCEFIYNPLSFCSEEMSAVTNKVLLFVSRLEIQQKGLDFLAEIAQELFIRRGHRDWKLQIVGNGSGYAQLEAWLKERNLEEQVQLLGEQQNVQDYYRNASIFLSTSRWEGFGLVLTEAMEYGLPVVSFETDGPAEILTDGENGYLIPNYDRKRFADAVETLMMDETLRKRMSRQAKKRAADFYPEKIVAQWEKIIEER